MKGILHSVRAPDRFTVALSLLFVALGATASAQSTYQAESAVLAGGTVTESVNAGYIGTGYVNSSATGGTTTFNNVNGHGGGTKGVVIRYALGNTARTGNLVVNGATRSITFDTTGAWTTWRDMTVNLPLNDTATNTIQFASTGQDLANIDQITIPAGPPPSGLEVKRWQPHTFSFVSATPPANPFTAAFSAVATGPGGVTLTLPGFYDGANTWKIRFSPTVVGAWSLRTSSNIADLNGKTATLTCVANDPANHGALKVDPAYPRNFIHEDGTRFYPMGYEADWLFALDLANASGIPVTAAFLDKIKNSGFNFVLLQVYAHDTSWRAGKTGTDDYGPPALYPWAGSNSSPDHSRLNVTFWQRFDRVVDALFQRGLSAHVMIEVYNKGVTWPANLSANDDLYFRTIIARYAAYPNVMWYLAKESNNEPTTSVKTNRLAFIRNNDPYKRLLTTHTDDARFNDGTYNTLCDWRAAQETETWRAPILSHMARRAWPIINVEFGYEQGPGGVGDDTYNHSSPPAEMARRAWENATTGAFVAYYYTYTAWDVVRPTHTPPGYAYMKNLRTFFEGTKYWLMKASDSLVTNSGFCFANPGKEYVVFHNTARTFNLTIAGASGALNVAWYNPLTAQRVSAGTVTNGTRTFTPPASLGTGQMVLHVWAP
jgi:hypothetical protein